MAFSKLSASLIKIPFSAPFPIPTIIAVGVANPKAHGQAITSTAIIFVKAWAKDPKSYQTTKVRTAKTKTIGTKYEDTISASFWIGARELCASDTILIIFESIVSPPTFFAIKRKDPDLFIVDPITTSPTVFPTGIDSPVTIDSSTELPPSIISPSTGIFSPGRTLMISPTDT